MISFRLYPKPHLVLLSVFGCIWASTPALSSDSPSASGPVICSFNIQFLGFFGTRDNEGLARMIKNEKCEVVLIQELTAPPDVRYLERNSLYRFPDLPAQGGIKAFPFQSGQIPEPIRPVTPATNFFEAMSEAGYRDFVLSEEDTGPTRNRVNSTQSEWWVAFYRGDRIKLAPDLPHGFLNSQRTGSMPYSRVPYAFPFRTRDGNFDFVLISVHLPPNSSQHQRRRDEMAAIQSWINENNEREKDFFVVGDFNIESRAELERFGSMQSLNGDCAATNTLPDAKSARPYDHVFFNSATTTATELPRERNFEVVNLMDRMRRRWQVRNPGKAYPGGKRDKNGITTGYVHDVFRMEYSDHHLIKFRLGNPSRDDD